MYVYITPRNARVCLQKMTGALVVANISQLMPTDGEDYLMYVCMYVLPYVCMYYLINVRVYAYTRSHMHEYIRTYVYERVYAYTHTYIHPYTYVCVCACVPTLRESCVSLYGSSEIPHVCVLFDMKESPLNRSSSVKVHVSREKLHICVLFDVSRIAFKQEIQTCMPSHIDKNKFSSIGQIVFFLNCT